MPSPRGKEPDPFPELTAVVDDEAVPCVVAGDTVCEVDEDGPEPVPRETVLVPQLARIAARPEKINRRVTAI